MEFALLRLNDAGLSAASWRYFSVDEAYDTDGKYILFKTPDSRWEIRERTSKNLVAFANTTAAHPTTIYLGEWQTNCDGASEWTYSPMHFAHEKLTTTFDRPIPIDLLGIDFFLRHRVNSIIWYIDPLTGSVVHSGSKSIKNIKSGAKSKRRSKSIKDIGPGVKFCSLCSCTVSANNFVSQHMRRVHSLEPLPGQHMLDKLAEII